jgi:MFS family permease
MPPTPVLSTRTLLTLCLASAAWAFSFGLGAPLASRWLQDALQDCEQSNTVIGLNTGTYYLGIALAAGLVPWLMRRWGRGCPLVGMVVSGLTVAWFPWGGGLAGWFVLRFLNGVAGAMSLIPLETYVNRHSATAQRSRNFGFYAFAIALGWALGSLVGLQLYAKCPRLAFGIGGSAGLAAGVIVLGWLPWPAEPHEQRRSRAPLAPLRNFLGFGSAWSQGFLEGGMVAFLAIYLPFLGLSDERAGWLMSGLMIGVILFQVPVAWLADRLGRGRVLLGCYAVTALGLALLPFCADSGWLVLWLFLVGACSGAFYPLGLALLGDRLPETALARAGAWYLGINCLGSLTGPVIMGRVMDHFGQRALFVVGAAAVVLIPLLTAGTHGYTCYRRRGHQEQDGAPATHAAPRQAA